MSHIFFEYQEGNRPFSYFITSIKSKRIRLNLLKYLKIDLFLYFYERNDKWKYEKYQLTWNIFSSKILKRLPNQLYFLKFFWFDVYFILTLTEAEALFCKFSCFVFDHMKGKKWDDTEAFYGHCKYIYFLFLIQWLPQQPVRFC